MRKLQPLSGRVLIPIQGSYTPHSPLLMVELCVLQKKKLNYLVHKMGTVSIPIVWRVLLQNHFLLGYFGTKKIKIETMSILSNSRLAIVLKGEVSKLGTVKDGRERLITF